MANTTLKKQLLEALEHISEEALVMDTFLRLNGYRLTLSDEAAYDLVIRTVRRALNKPGIAQELANALRQR